MNNILDSLSEVQRFEILSSVSEYVLIVKVLGGVRINFPFCNFGSDGYNFDTFRIRDIRGLL